MINAECGSSSCRFERLAFKIIRSLHYLLQLLQYLFWEVKIDLKIDRDFFTGQNCNTFTKSQKKQNLELVWMGPKKICYGKKRTEPYLR